MRLMRIQVLDVTRAIVNPSSGSPSEGYVKFSLVTTRARCTHQAVASVEVQPSEMGSGASATPGSPTTIDEREKSGSTANPQTLASTAPPMVVPPMVVPPMVVPEDDEEDAEDELESSLSDGPVQETHEAGGPVAPPMLPTPPIRTVEMLRTAAPTDSTQRGPVRPATRTSVQDLGRDIRGLQDTKCCIFPIRIRPQASYTQGKTKFAARRSGGRRLHAGVDLYTPQATPFRAVADGRILQGPYRFYQGTYALEVLHQGGFVVRYGEIFPQLTRGLGTGSRISAGQDLGRIKKTRCCHPMLHFELYSGQARGALSQRSGNRFQRRRDIIDPTAHMLRWEQKSFRVP